MLEAHEHLLEPPRGWGKWFSEYRLPCWVLDPFLVWNPFHQIFRAHLLLLPTKTLPSCIFHRSAPAWPRSRSYPRFVWSVSNWLWDFRLFSGAEAVLIQSEGSALQRPCGLILLHLLDSMFVEPQRVLHRQILHSRSCRLLCRSHFWHHVSMSRSRSWTAALSLGEVIFNVVFALQRHSLQSQVKYHITPTSGNKSDLKLIKPLS